LAGLCGSGRAVSRPGCCGEAGREQCAAQGAYGLRRDRSFL